MSRSLFRASSRFARVAQPPLLVPSRNYVKAVEKRQFSSGNRQPINSASIVISEHMTQKTTRNLLQNIDLLVCDMAGTVVDEGGIVYETLQRVMIEDGLDVPNDAMHPWHGAKKEAVIEHFALKVGNPSPAQVEERVTKIADAFLKAIEASYFGESSSIKFIDPSLEVFIRQLQLGGVKVALDTGYPPEIQQGLIKKLGFENLVDGYISAYQVAEGRPFPYMIHRLMERLRIESVRRVAKAGDSVRDIEEGHNAGCGLVIGVLSGADSAEALLGAGADIIIDKITDLPIPQKKIARRLPGGLRGLPDLS